MSAQQPKINLGDTLPRIKVLDINPRYLNEGDSVWVYSGICKTLKVGRFAKNEYESQIRKPRTSAIKVHGNVLYDFLYRSYSDTPYYQRDFRQHTLQSSINVTVNDKVSYRFNFLLRKSNSPWFKNFLDLGLQLDKNSFLSNMKDLTLQRIIDSQFQKPDLKVIEDKIKKEYEKINDINIFLNKPDLTQLIIEEREKLYYQRLRNAQPGMNVQVDSVMKGIGDYTMKKRSELDSLQKIISKLQGKHDSLKNKIATQVATLRNKIYSATNIKELEEINSEYGIPNESKSKWEEIMSNIKSIGIGRTIVNYSELTASNVSLTGLNIEYNPRIYAAFAIGKIDYGFRDFLGRNNNASKQNLLMGRFGIGDIDKKAVILSLFTGKKYNYGTVLNDTVNGYINIVGYSVEGILRKNENVSISAEVAKSTRPVSGTIVDNKESGSLFRFSDESNLGISIKGKTIIPETHTRLSGFFRKTGENFQSFSLFTYNTDQTAWLLKADQSLVKDNINLVAMLRRNDFTNPFTEKTFKTTTVFTSAQLNVKFPKWPSISVGYFPGTQLYIINRERVRENVYHILNGTLVYTYSLSGTRMMSSVIYNRYSNKGTDSGFINYKGVTYLLSHSVMLRKFQVSGNYTLTDQQELKYFTVEANADYSPGSKFRMGAGGKYNKTTDGKVYWGGNFQLVFEIKKLGGLQFQYEKSFLPTIYQTLFPVEMGRVSWFKYF
ncbi:MAG: hypothetical protein E6H07_12805 [Bacteroidetes bacterium]|nr:MAG: hypothetical protein E6H07_12805 [Bacteroidota bacterium]